MSTPQILCRGQILTYNDVLTYTVTVKFKHKYSGVFVLHQLFLLCKYEGCSFYVQVCEVYKLHKETYYMAMDFIDRFLLATNGMKTSQLQLLGVTALFVAAKIEVRCG